MSGYPDYPSRDAFGPTMDTSQVPVVPTRDVGGGQFNLDWWQVAGAGLMVPRAWVGITASGARSAAAESWNANQNGALHPVVVHIATGFYLVAYASTAVNELGSLRPIALQWVECDVQSATNAPWSTNGALVPPAAWAAVTNFPIGSVATNGSNTYVSTAQVATTVAAGSDGAVLPQSTIHLTSTASLPTSGSVFFPDLNTTVAYTGLGAGNTLTGCTGGSGTLALGDAANACSATSGGPTGVGSSISDGGITWAYVAPSSVVGVFAVISVSQAGTPTDCAVLVKFR